METVCCDICGCGESYPLFNRGRGGEAVVNVVCRNCGLVFVSPRRTAGQCRELYVGGEFNQQARGGVPPERKKIEASELVALRRFRRLLQHLDIGGDAAKVCLEIGCGIGSFLRLMRGAQWQVRGLEPDTTFAESGAALYGLDIEKGLYEDQNYGVEALDLVAAFHVLEHVRSPRAFLTKIYGELKAGGALLLEVPCIERPYGGDLDQFFWSCHLYSFSRQTLCGLLANVGFSLLADGYEGEFLWVLAVKSSPQSLRPLALPLEDPQGVIARTRETRRHYLWGHSPLRKAAHAGFDLLTRAGRKLLLDPAGLLPALGRRLGVCSRPVERGGEESVHLGLHDPGNAGDTLLFVVVRRLLDQDSAQPWRLEPLWAPVTEERVARWNATARYLLIGGGGLFLRDTNQNEESGWQWPCSVEALSRIEVPLILFAVGYNRFRNQDEFNDRFAEQLRQVIEHSAFVGLRNHGSIRALKRYLPAECWPKLTFQPCPTTLLKYLYPDMHAQQCLQRRRLALNVAFDRHPLRFGHLEKRILTQVAEAIHWASARGWAIDLVSHVPLDATILPWLVRRGIPFREVNLHAVSSENVMSYYRDVPLVVGMRGHSQMIPFGWGNAIISLISHDKMKWFLDDVGHAEWGIEVTAENLAERLKDAIALAESDLPARRTEIARLQAELWQVTKENLTKIRPLLFPPQEAAINGENPREL